MREPFQQFVFLRRPLPPPPHFFFPFPLVSGSTSSSPLALVSGHCRLCSHFGCCRDVQDQDSSPRELGGYLADTEKLICSCNSISSSSFSSTSPSPSPSSSFSSSSAAAASSMCFFLSRRRFPTQMQTKRFLGSRTSGSHGSWCQKYAKGLQ